MTKCLHKKRERLSWVKPSWPYFGLKSLSEYKLQNRGSYLFWRVFFDFASKSIGSKGESRCTILDMSSNLLEIALPPLREIRDNMGAIRSVWTIFRLDQNRGHYKLFFYIYIFLLMECLC